MSLCEVYMPEECEKCRFCCSFRRTSLGETPLIDEELLEKLKKLYPEAKFKFVDGYYTVDLDNLYKTDDPEEEALCYFNKGKGCILGDDKPLGCRIWPFRVMKCGENLAIALNNDCPAFANKTLAEIYEALNFPLEKEMLDYAMKIPAFATKYHGNHTILKIFEDK